MNYPNFNNHEISTIVAYSISEKSCEIARQRFYEEFGKQAPPTRTLNDWRKRLGRLLVYYRSQADQKKPNTNLRKKEARSFDGNK